MVPSAVVRRGLLPIAALLPLTLAAASDAPACSIVLPTVVIPGSATAPLNTHVWVLDVEWVTRDALQTFALRSAPGGDGGAGASVAVETFVYAGWASSIEMVPRAPLAPSSRYEVWAVGSHPHLVGSFMTGDAPARVAPAPPQFRSPQFGLTWSPECGVAELEVPVVPPDDAPGSALYALYYADATGAVRYDRPPDGLAPAATRGRPLLAYAAGHELTKVSRIGVRAVDAAGNVSTPVEITRLSGP
jgi:hypothetical protein